MEKLGAVFSIPQPNPEAVVVVAVVVVVVVGVTVVSQVKNSFPVAAKAALLRLRRAALLDTPSIPVGVPVRGKITSGLE